MRRYLEGNVLDDLKKKMVFVAGPRQAGKTSLAKTILGAEDGRCFNWDDENHREAILKREFPNQPGYLVLDEIHKYARWRNWLKGFYDTHKARYQILVTGSAKLDFYRKGGDSLQGRYNLLRLHPLSLAELEARTRKDLDALFRFGPFPEPFLSQSEDESRRWSRQYRSRLVREELLSLEKVSEVSLVEQLMIRLPDLIGSPLSINSLKNEIQTSQPTLSRWIELLERIYALYRIYPFGGPKIRAIKKASKLYFFDWNAVHEAGSRFENLVANHLYKWCQYVEDVKGYDMELRYFRDKDQREVDFIVVQDREPILAVEAKLSEQQASKDLAYLKGKFPNLECVQVVKEMDKDIRNAHGIRICGAHHFLKELI